MKLLIISDAWHPQVNGVVRTYEYLAEELEKMGHEVRVIGPCDFKRRMPMPGYAEIQLAIMPQRQLSAMIDDYAPDNIHVATEGPLGWAARRYCLRRGRAFSTSYHTHFPDYVAKRFSRFLPFLYRPIHRACRAWVRHFHNAATLMMVATPSLEAELKGWGFSAPMYRLSRGARLDQFYPGEKTLFQDLPKPVALYVGRVAVEKNIEAFLDMDWAGSKVIVGHGPSLDALKAAYPKAHFVGKKEGAALGDHYRSADVFVFPSRTDTFGIVLIEALAVGLPVAAYNVTGPKDIIVEPFLGSLHEDDLRAACDAALACGEAQERADYTRAHYSWANAARQYAGVLKDMDEA